MLSMIVIAAGIAFIAVSCGPTAKEIEDKRIADSIMVADSIALVQAISDTICVDTAVIESVTE